MSFVAPQARKFLIVDRWLEALTHLGLGVDNESEIVPSLCKVSMCALLRSRECQRWDRKSGAVIHSLARLSGQIHFTQRPQIRGATEENGHVRTTESLKSQTVPPVVRLNTSSTSLQTSRGYKHVTVDKQLLEAIFS